MTKKHYYNAETVFSAEAQEFLKQDPYKLNYNDKQIWFKLKNDLKFYNQKIGCYRGNILLKLGYDMEFIGHKNPNTNKSISFYSWVYAKRHNKGKSHFNSCDSFCAFKRKIISTETNYGFIQKEYSDVLWLDLDCHDDSLYEYYVRIKNILKELFKYCMLCEEKNNGKGTHIWLFLDKQLSSKERRQLHKNLQIIIHTKCNIPMNVCKKVIDTPKSWFRVPGTPDYLPSGTIEYTFYYDFNHRIETRHDFRTDWFTENLPAVKESKISESVSSPKAVQDESTEAHNKVFIKFNSIVSSGFSKDNYLNEIKMIVAIGYYGTNASDIDSIANSLKDHDKDNILPDISNLRSIVENLLIDFKEKTLSRDEIWLFAASLLDQPVNSKNPEIDEILKNGLTKGCSYNQLGIIIPYLYYNCKITDVDNLLEQILSMGNGKGSAEILSNKSELRARIEYLVSGCSKYTMQHNKAKWTDVTNWRSQLSTEQQLAERSIIIQFQNKNKHLVKKYDLSIEKIMSLADNFILNYFKIKDFTQYENLSGNLSSKYIAKHFGLTGHYYGVCKKIAILCSNLYGFHLVLDNNGNYYVPGRFCARYVIMADTNIASKDRIISIIGQSILDFKEQLKYIKIKHIYFKVVQINSFKEKITSIKKADPECMRKYEQVKKDKLDRIHTIRRKAQTSL